MWIGILEMLLCAAFYECFMIRFEKIRRWHLYGFALFTGIAQGYLLRMTDTLILQFIIYMVLHAVLGILFTDAFRVVWLYFVCYAGVMFLFESGMSVLDFLVFRGRFPDTMRQILVFLLQLLFVYYVYYFKRVYAENVFALPWMTFIFPLVSLGFVLGFWYWQLSEGKQNYESGYFVIAFATAVNILYYVLVEKIILSCGMEMRRREYEQKNEDYYEHYYRQLENQQQEIRGIRHDMKNQLIGILGELKMGDTVRAKSEMTRILKGIEETENIFYSSNPGMNALLNFKSNEMKRKQIRFQCEVDLPRDIKVEAKDIGILVGNILDNAIEGCERCFGKRYISLKTVYRNNTVTLVCENSTDGLVESFNTRKEDKLAHGMGIQSMKRLVKSYGGEIDFQIYEKAFCVTVILFQV